jgi:hypothetical protein
MYIAQQEFINELQTKIDLIKNFLNKNNLFIINVTIKKIRKKSKI